MADYTLKTAVLIKRGSTEDRKTADTNKHYLKDGELGYNTTTKICKVGDGLTPWSNLPIFNTTEVTQSEDGYILVNGQKIQVVDIQSINAKIDTKYTLPAGGKIPQADLATEVQNKLNAALVKEDISEGTQQGSINVDGINVKVHGLGSAAYKNTGDFTLKTEFNQHVSDYSSTINELNTEIDSLKNTVSSGVTFKGKVTTSTLPPATSYKNGDLIIFNKKEYILYENTSTHDKEWIELGDEGAYLTESMGDARYRKKTDKINVADITGLHRVATTGSYSDLTGIPEIGNGTITIKQNGASKGVFTLNQQGNTTIELTDTDTNTNTWRPIKMNGTEILGGATTTGALNLKAGSNITLNKSATGEITIASTATSNNQTVKGNGTAFDSNAAVDIVGGGSTTVTAGTNKITISSTDTNTSHNHSAGVGLVGSGSAGVSGGTYTYKANLVNETADTNAAPAPVSKADRIYPVRLDKNSKLAVVVPWTDTNTNNNQTVGVGSTTFGADDTVKFVAGTNVQVTASASAKTITIASQHTHNKNDITGLTASKAVVTDIGGKLTTATTTATEIGYLSGVKSSVQTQITNAAKTAQEAYLTWGGKNFTGSYGPIDAAMIPTLGANRLAFDANNVNGIVVEYSRDGGTTWQDYESSASSKANLFNGLGASFVIGKDTTTKKDKTAYMLRATITTDVSTIYTVLNKFAIYCSTNGSSGCYCTIEGRTKADVDEGRDTWKVFVDKQSIAGWSGWNIINTTGITTYGNTTAHYQNIRFTFGVASHSATSPYAGLSISKILGFGGVGWGTATNLALNGTIYNYDSTFNALFPADIRIKTGSKCSAAGELVASQTWATANLVTMNTAQTVSATKTFTQGIWVDDTHIHKVGNRLKFEGKQLYLLNGAVFGGTAAAAGLVTRGVCGININDPDTGNYDKDNLYINYDGDNTYRSNRQLVLQAGSVGNHYGNNVYQYTAVRGDALKDYLDNHISKNIITTSTGTANAATTNGNTYLKHLESATETSKHLIKGAGTISVTSDGSGNITIQDGALSGGAAAGNNTTVVGGVTVNGHAISAPMKTITGTRNVSVAGNTSSITITGPDLSNYVQKSELSGMGAMVFKGTLGTSGTITQLPTASANVLGHTYKVITKGTYGGIAAKVGDTFVCYKTGSAYAWILIPSGDEPSGTVTSITVGGGLTGSTSPITTSGTISHGDTSSQASIGASARRYISSVTLDGYGHVTHLDTATETVVDTNQKVSIKGSGFGSNDTVNFVEGDNITLSKSGTQVTVKSAPRYVLDNNDPARKTTFCYSKDGLGFSAYTWLAGWNGNELRAVNKDQFVNTTQDQTVNGHKKFDKISIGHGKTTLSYNASDECVDITFN